MGCDFAADVLGVVRKRTPSTEYRGLRASALGSKKDGPTRTVNAVGPIWMVTMQVVQTIDGHNIRSVVRRQYRKACSPDFVPIAPTPKIYQRADANISVTK